MSKKDKLHALAGVYQSEQLDGSITSLSISDIEPSENQPRKDVMVGIEGLAKSVEKNGLMSPIVVRKVGDVYKIIAGERRYHAVNSLGWSEVECRILDVDDDEAFLLAVVENIQREDLTPFEEVGMLLEMKSRSGYTHAELADKLSKSRSYVSEILSVASLPPEVLSQARSIGVNSKNLLIQLVQAYKNNNVQVFMDSFKSGVLTTVKQAKEFNSKSKKPPIQKNKAKVKSAQSDSMDENSEVSRVNLKVNYGENYIVVKFLDSMDRSMIDRLKSAIEKEFT